MDIYNYIAHLTVTQEIKQGKTTTYLLKKKKKKASNYTRLQMMIYKVKAKKKITKINH